jgi:hypothetical protein
MREINVEETFPEFLVNYINDRAQDKVLEIKVVGTSWIFKDTHSYSLKVKEHNKFVEISSKISEKNIKQWLSGFITAQGYYLND